MLKFFIIYYNRIKFLKIIEQHLDHVMKDRVYLLGNNLTLADIVLYYKLHEAFVSFYKDLFLFKIVYNLFLIYIHLKYNFRKDYHSLKNKITSTYPDGSQMCVYLLIIFLIFFMH